MKRYDTLKDLLDKAGKYPELQLTHNDTDKVYECPLCGGSGDIEGIHVSQGTATSGSGLDISIAGVQVFGIGDAMQAMEKLIPLAIHHLPELISASEDAARIIAQRDRLAQLLTLSNARFREYLHEITWREYDPTPDHQCVTELIALNDEALAELDKEKQS